jgi:hypothetical protein
MTGRGVFDARSDLIDCLASIVRRMISNSRTAAFAAAASGGALRASLTSNSSGASLCQANDAEICLHETRGLVSIDLAILEK